MSKPFDPTDEKYMRRALTLARRGLGRVEPNPMVGCVLVRKGEIISEGYHKIWGSAHAETNALDGINGSAKGATAYVTLEPCCHYGKTPPCSDALIEAGVKRVVAAMKDPGENVNGKGFRQLRKAGIQVDVGLLEDEAVELNRPYIKRIRTGKPYVILKWAQTLDGKIATRTGDSKWISGSASRRVAHQLRARVDGILVGIGTALADNPLLTARNVPIRRKAARIVLDPELAIKMGSQLVQTAHEFPTVLATTRQALNSQAEKVAKLEKRGVQFLKVPVRKGLLDLSSLLDELSQLNLTNIMVEGGAQVLQSFLQDGLADEMHVFVAPILIGGEQSPSVPGGKGVATIAEGIKPESIKTRRIHQDMLLEIQFPAPWL